MKYEAAQQGKPYEGNLTAESLVEKVWSLIETYIPSGELVAARKETNILKYGKLWDNPQIRDELIDFIRSYYNGPGEHSPSPKELKKRKDKLFKEIHRIPHIDGDTIKKQNAKDSLSQLVMVYDPDLNNV